MADADDDVLRYVDPGLSAEPSLLPGQRLMMRGRYAKALAEFRRVYDQAAASGNLLLEADAAGRCGWSYSELEQFDDGRRWLFRSIDLVQGSAGSGLMPLSTRFRPRKRRVGTPRMWLRY